MEANFADLPPDIQPTNIPLHMNGIVRIIGFLAAGTLILYMTCKHSDYKTQTSKNTKRSQLLSNTKLTDRLNNKNLNQKLYKTGNSMKYPSSSRMRYNKRRYLK